MVSWPSPGGILIADGVENSTWSLNLWQFER